MSEDKKDSVVPEGDPLLAAMLKKHSGNVTKDGPQRPTDDLTVEGLKKYNLPDHQIPLKAELPYAKRREVALKTAAKITEYNKMITAKMMKQQALSGELDSDMSDYYDREVNMSMDKDEMDSSFEYYKTQGIKEENMNKEELIEDNIVVLDPALEPLNGKNPVTKEVAIDVENAPDDGEYVDDEMDDEEVKEDSQPDIYEADDSIGEEQSNTHGPDKKPLSKPVPETAIVEERKPQPVKPVSQIAKEEKSVDDTKYKQVPTSESEFLEYTKENALKLKTYQTVEKAPRHHSSPEYANDDMIDAIIANRTKTVMEKDSIHGVQSILIHSGYVGSTRPLSHSDLDEIDKISLTMDGPMTKAVWIKIVNFLYSHLSTESSGFRIPDIDSFKAVTSHRDIPLLCYDLIRATWTEKAIPFTFRCNSPQCKKAAKNGKPTMITHGVIAEDLQSIVIDKFQDVVKKSKEIVESMGDTSEWINSALMTYRSLLNFEDSCGVVIELQGQSLDRFLKTVMTDEDFSKLSNSEENSDEYLDLIETITKRTMIGRIRRLMVVGPDGLLHNVPKARWDYIIDNLLGPEEKGILNKAVEDIDGDNMIKFSIKKAICPVCKTAHTNITVDPVDMLFNVRAAYGRGWEVEKNRKH